MNRSWKTLTTLPFKIANRVERSLSGRRVFTNNSFGGENCHPFIDVSPLLSSDGINTEKYSSTVAQIGRAIQERGYFYAQNVSVLPQDYLNDIYDYSHRLHALPVNVKKKFAQINGHGSYSGIDIGQPELAYDPATVASVRGWDYSRTNFTLSSSTNKNQDINNLYPSSKDGMDPPYETVLDELYERQNILARALMIAFAECLELPKSTFVDMFDGKNEQQQQQSKSNQGDFGTIRLLYYPGSDESNLAEANVGISAHTDFEAFTLMHQSAPGLQFLVPENNNKKEKFVWLDAPARTEEFVVIIGDALERITNGHWRATPHRVKKTRHPRWSIIRFNAFAPQTLLTPLEKFVTTERPASYSPVTMKVHMETTMKNLQAGFGAWDDASETSLTANYLYIDGKDHRRTAEQHI